MNNPELDYRLLLKRVWDFWFKEESALREKEQKIFFGKIFNLWMKKYDKWGRVLLCMEDGFKREDSGIFLKWLKTELNDGRIELQNGVTIQQVYASALFLHGNSCFGLEFVADFLGVSMENLVMMRDRCEELRMKFIIQRLHDRGCVCNTK